MLKVVKKEITSFPNEDELENGIFKGTMLVTAIFYDINPVLIIQEHPENKGPELGIAIDYYGPDIAQRMGLKVDKTKFVVRSSRKFDDEYVEVTLPGICKDAWGRFHAGSGDVEWKAMSQERFKLILNDIGEEPTKHLGKVGIFVGREGMVRRRIINSYDGQNYYDPDNQKAYGDLVRVERVEK